MSLSPSLRVNHSHEGLKLETWLIYLTDLVVSRRRRTQFLLKVTPGKLLPTDK